MKPPKNFYSNLDRRKQGLPELPEASASDAGKIIKVSDTGDYELGNDAGDILPVVTDADNGTVLQVQNGVWGKSGTIIRNRILVTDNNANVVGTLSTSAIITKRGSTWTYSMYGYTVNRDAFNVYVVYSGISDIIIDDDGLVTRGTIISRSPTTIVGSNVNGLTKITLSPGSFITYVPVGSVKYYEIETSGSSVSLPSGVTFADVYAELMAGVDVKFTSGARVYSVTSFESTNIRAHWMTDLDLTNMEVYVINLASDGTGTVASATFSGS